MGKVTCYLCALALVACGGGKPTDTVDSLLANPDRLKEIMRQCHEDHAKVGDAECNAASEAFRRRYIGTGSSQQTPKP